MRGSSKFFTVLLVTGLLCGCAGSNGEKQQDPLPDVTFQPQLNENGREEVRLSTGGLSVTMREIIVDYNKQSDRYEIIPEEFDRTLSYDDQRSRIQLDLAAGEGPDLLSYTALQEVNMSPYAEEGLLLDVTDFLAGEGEFVSHVAEANQLDGRIYGVPYAFSLNTVVTSQEMATDRENWTAEYCMRTAKEKGCTAFIKAPWGWTKEEGGMYVLNVLGVGRPGIQLFVDEERGISSFEQPQFQDLLAFADAYADPEPEMSDREKIASGEIFCTAGGIRGFDGFWYYEAEFEGEPVYMGYPSPQGGQHVIMAESFYINAASPHAQGALDFLRYLLTDEQQRRLAVENRCFPVKQELLERMWQEAKEEKIVDAAYEMDGLYYAARPMTDEEEQIFWEMLEYPVYYQWVNYIWDTIIWEEALPFFHGEKPAEETARAIDSRVQLYLDERGAD